MKRILSMFIIIIKLVSALDDPTLGVHSTEILKSDKTKQLINLKKSNGTVEFIVHQKTSVEFSELDEWNQNIEPRQSDIYQVYGNVNGFPFYTYVI